ncbi:hypothetical protein [Thiorhodovibrio frisius]|nr:hypothetical protein [Thiorhodovibrio frisius]
MLWGKALAAASWQGSIHTVVIKYRVQNTATSAKLAGLIVIWFGNAFD